MGSRISKTTLNTQYQGRRLRHHGAGAPEGETGDQGELQIQGVIGEPKPDDDAGHLISKLLGGSGGVQAGKLMPQKLGVNRGSFRHSRTTCARWSCPAKPKFVRIVPHSAPGQTRPYELCCQVRYQGETIQWVFPGRSTPFLNCVVRLHPLQPDRCGRMNLDE